MSDVSMTVIALPNRLIGVQLTDSETVVNGIAKPSAVDGFRDLLDGRGVASVPLHDADEDEVGEIIGKLERIIERPLN